MLSSPISDNYRLHLSKGFIYDSVVDKISSYTDTNMPFYDNLVDYVNATITEAKIPGIIAPITDSQSSRSGKSTRVFKGQNPYKEKIEKRLTLSFSLKSGYVNWAIMYMQMEEFLKSDTDTFLPAIYLEVMDMAGIVLFRMEFHDVTMERISDISFSTNGSIVKDKFDVQFLFNEYKMVFEYSNAVNQFNEKYHY